jgi:large repetitive protein
MRRFLRFIFIFSFSIISNISFAGIFIDFKTENYNFGNFATTNTNAPASISATITGGTSVCQNDPSPTITFTGSGGNTPYTFKYKINNGPDLTVSSVAGNNKAIVFVDTHTPGDFIYTLTNVSDLTPENQDLSTTTTITVNPFPVVDFTFNDNQCSGSGIQFSSTVNGPCTYAWDFGDGSTSTDANPNHEFSAPGTGTKTFIVKLTVTNTATGCKQSVDKEISLLEAPDPTINSDVESGIFNGQSVFKKCSSAATIITFSNASTTLGTNNASYKISWGDGSPDFTATTWGMTTHTYSLGFWNLTYTITGIHGCSVTKVYKVFVGSNPAGTLIPPGNTDICGNNTITFPISGTENNPPGTTYTITFSDAPTAPITFIHPAPASITHTFTKSSCGHTTPDGMTNSFYAKLVSSNPCGTTAGLVEPIYVSTPPQADFSITATNTCVNNQICITNTTTGSVEITNNGTSSSCSTALKTIWEITPSTGFTLNSGDMLGNEYGTTNVGLWTSGSSSICPTFTVPGTYTISMKAANRCGISQKIVTICVEPILVPLFTLDTNEGCAPLLVKATNTTDISKSCKVPTYLWQVTYAAANCGTTSAYTYTSGTSASSESPSFQFTNPGTYTLKLTINTLCNPTSITKTIIVKKPPTVTINSISDYCASASINPIATINNCAPTNTGMTYAWSFPGGTPTTANTEIPGTITYSSPGNYTVSLTVTNECAIPVTATKNFAVNVVPVLANSSLAQTICSGHQTELVALTANPSNATFSWTATATPGITGFAPSGTTNTIPIQTINSTIAIPGTITYAITPKLGNCTGTVVNYVVTVNPSPHITTHPNSSAVCKDGVATPLTVTYTNGTGTGTYQWYSNSTNSNFGGTLINGATTDTYIPSTSTIGTTYYYCVISPSGSCSDLFSNPATVTVNPLLGIQNQPMPSQNICVGGTIASPLAVSYSGGAGTATYQWYSNSSNSNTGGTPISGATSSSYTPPAFSTTGTSYYYVEVTLSGNNCGSKSSDAAEIIVVNDPTITEQPKTTQTLCQGSTPTDLKVAATGGVGTYAYQWYRNTTTGTSTETLIPGATNQTYTPPTTTVGTVYYNCLITQPSGPNCSVISDAAEVIIKLAPTFTSQPLSSAVCENGNANILSVSCANGVGTPTYQWYSNTTNSNTSGSKIDNATNTNFNPPTSTIGTTYYYCVISFPSGSCTEISSNPASVTVNSIPVIQTQPTPLQNICVGGTISSPLTVSYSGGAGTPSYQWYSSTTNSTATGTLIPGATNPNYTPAPFSSTGTYYFYAEVTLSGSNCSSHYSDIAQINVVSDPIVVTQPIQNQTLCQSATPENLTVEATGGIGAYTYQWYQNATNNTTTGMIISGATNKTYTPSTSSIGTKYYYCTILQLNGPGCNVTSETAKVTTNAAPTITNQPVSSSVCLKEIPATLNVAYINGAGTPQFQWYSNTTNSVTGSTLIPNANTANYNPPHSIVGTMYYYCVITLPAGGCNTLISNIATVTINQYPVISSTNSHIGSGTSFIVNPITTATDTVPTGTTYTWSLQSITPANSITGASAQSVAQTSISQTLTNVTKAIATATYIVTPRSGNCNGADFNVVVTIDPPLSPNTTLNNISCFGANNGSIQTNIQGGNPPYTILWAGPNAFTSSQPAISDLVPGNYDLKITDNGGLPFTINYTISEPAEIEIKTDLIKNISCFGAANGKIDISVSGGTTPYIYNWTKDGLAFATSEDISSLTPGSYTVSVTDANNCGPKTAAFTISEPTPLVLTLINQTNLICFGDSVGTISINAQGGTPIEKSPGTFDYNYSWSGPNGYTNTNKNLTHLVAGPYTLTITDNNGCTQNLAVNITQPDEVTIKTVVTQVTCFGANDATIKLDISGGVPPYQIQWSNFGKGTFQDNLSPGDYTVTVVDANTCQKTVNINIHEAQFYIEPTTKNISCFGAHNGSISLNVHGGIAPVSLVWLDNATAGSTRNNLAPGTYTAILSDASSCSFTKVFTIIEPQELKLSAAIKNAFDCNNPNSGAISLVVSGGSQPYSYAWSNGATTKNLSNIPAGTYVTNITDANGCTLSEKFEIMRQLPISLSVNIVPVYNCETNAIKETCKAQITGGIPPYQCTWSSGTTKGASNEIMESSQSGIVILGVTDGLGCTQNYTFDLHIPNQGIDFHVTNCNDHVYGFNALIPIGQASDYTYFWDFGDGKTETMQNPEHKFSDAGTYKVSLTLKNSSCTSVYEKHITVEPAPNLVLDKLPIFCTGDSILLHVSGADSYHWSNNSAGDSLLIKQPGDYFVIGTSKTGCTSTLSFKATNFSSYNYTIQSDKNEITTDNPSVQLWSESITYSDYFWDFGDGKSAQGNNIDHYYDNLKDGYYEVKLKVKNPNGCNEFATKKIWTTNTSTNNVFTPNGDGIDDVFMQGWHIKVYNRNGILLYDGTAGWDGTFNGKPVSNDTYFYIVYISSVSGIKSNTGFITVIR